LPSSNSSDGSSSAPNNAQSEIEFRQDGIQERQSLKSASGKSFDVLQSSGIHLSKGGGRFVRTFVQIPVDISVGLTKGFHNFPKLWGDETVRRQEKISGVKSGFVAAGKEFGFGWYDGITGLVSQPWRGAQKEGAVGFVKGFGKGLGGFAAKPLAGFAGLLGHTMKGVHKEVQKLFSDSVQNYIVASRVAQGYEEWLQCSDAEKQDILAGWELIQASQGRKTPA
jgi:hypothetical protein